MRRRSEISIILGVLIWVGLLSGGFLLLRQAMAKSDKIDGLTTYLTKSRSIVRLDFDRTAILKVGDPIFVRENGEARQIGIIQRLNQVDSTDAELDFADVAYAELFANAPPLSDGDSMTFHATPDSIGWVVQMMLPPETRQEIGKLILQTYVDEKDAIVGALKPVIENSVREAAAIVREDFEIAFKKRDLQVQALGQKFRSDVVEQKLIPLMKEEIWPIVQEESQPLAEEIGQEIWKEVSLLRFGWAALRDKMPLREQKNLTKKEFDKFVEEHALPIFESHMPEMIDLQQVLIRKISESDEVKLVVTDTVKTIVNDPEVQQLLTEVFREVFVDNQRLKDVMDRNWKSPEAKQALALTNSKLEPTITKIGQTLFGSPNQRITPEFSRVLRHKILHKDDRWLMLHPADASLTTQPLQKDSSGYVSLTVQRGGDETDNPFHIPASPKN